MCDVNAAALAFVGTVVHGVQDEGHAQKPCFSHPCGEQDRSYPLCCAGWRVDLGPRLDKGLNQRLRSIAG